MKRRTQAAVAGAAVLALGGLGTGVVAAAGVGDDDASEHAITGAAEDKAEQAALAEVGEGKVTGTEVDDEQGKYEVEVTKDDGTQVDVHLDENFAVIGTEDEGSEEGSEGSGSDD
jgi:uncharacterized membrane protein YkoI